MTFDEKYAIGAIYYGPACGVCGSRRTEALPYRTRLCHVCGTEGRVAVGKRMFGEKVYHVYLEPVR